MAAELAELAAEFEALRVADAPRLNRYREYLSETEDEVRGSDLNSDIGDLDYGRAMRSDGIKARRHRFTIPLGQATTVKHAYRISGRLPDAVVDRRAETPEERYRSDTMEKIWWGITRESQGEQEFATAAWDSSKLGAACFEAYWNLDKMMPQYRAVDPCSVLVVAGLDDPHEFQRVYRFWTAPTVTVRSQYRGHSFRGDPINVDQIQATTLAASGNQQVTMMVECCDATSRTRFAFGEGGQWTVGLYEQNHNYGFTPHVVIPNLGPARNVWGWADYEFIRALARYIPVLLGREADILKATANGAYLESKTGQPLTTVQQVIAEGGILQGGREGKVEPIQAPDVPAFAESHQQMAMELFKMVGFAPDAAWGDGGAGSGSDRGLQLQPQLELTGLKQQNWGAGLGRLGSMLFRMVEAKMPSGSTARYVGTATKAHRRSPFNFIIGPGAAPDTVSQPTSTFDPSIDLPSEQTAEQITLPRDPVELFDKDYGIRFVWHNRINPDDPAFVTAELNKFAQGAQSLRTTLERFGVENPEDEMRLIEQEAERFPWLRQGLIQMIRDQLAQQESGGAGQGVGGGNPTAGAPDASAALAMTGTKDGAALDKHAMVAGLGQSGVSFNGQ